MGNSVSRVGGSAQVKAMKAVAGRLRLDLAQFRELAAFAMFASDLDKATQAMLAKGQRLTEILKQDQYQPLTMEKQVVIIYAATNGYLDAYPVTEGRRYEKELYTFLETRHPDLLKQIAEKKDIKGELDGQAEGGPRGVRGHLPGPGPGLAAGKPPMPALVDIRRRIRSVKNTQQITKAMKMVSAAKLRRAQEAMFAARPYARKMMEVLNSLATRADPDTHPLLQERGEDKVLLVIVTADKGLCGGFNANIIRAAVAVPRGAAGEDLRLDLDRPQGPRLLQAPALAIRTETSASSSRSASRPRARSRDQLMQDLRGGGGGRGLPRLQRVQERDPAEGRGRAAAAHHQADLRPEGAGPRLPLRAGPGADLRRACCPGTSSSRCGGRSSSRRPPSTARA